MTVEEAEVSHMQNIIIRALGSEATVEVDVEDMVALPGDTLLLATDGLTKHVKDPKMLELIKGAATLDAANDALIKAAKEHGGDDNITAILIRVSELPWYKRWFGGGQPAKRQNSM